MKRIFTFILTVAVVLSTCGIMSAQGRKDVIIDLGKVHLDASFKQFKKANKTNQSEILNELIRQANEVYLDCEDIDDVYELQEVMKILQRYQDSSKQAFISVQHSINTLNRKINRTVNEYEGGTFNLDRKGYDDRGQELD